MLHQVKRKRDRDGDSSPTGPPHKRQRSGDDTVSAITQGLAEQGLAYRPGDAAAGTVLSEEQSENGIQLADISSEKLPAARAQTPVPIQSAPPAKSPRKRPKGHQKGAESTPSPKKPLKAIDDSEDDANTIIVNGSKDPDFVPDADIISHPDTKTTKPKLKQKRQKPNPPIDPLFWQPFELTGDKIDDPDDDGEGLHGVGFELLPERAYAVRREKRRKIAEWKAVVASEAREARSNRRSIFGPHSDPVQGDIASTPEIDAAKREERIKKAVRFAA